MTAPPNGTAPGKWEAGLTPAMIAQVKVVGAPRWLGAGQIAYVQDHNQRADIYVTDAEGGLPLQITADRPPTPVFTGGFGSGYAVAPDGGTIVYTSPEDGKLHAASTAGGKVRRITEGEGGHGSPQFSPDGQATRLHRRPHRGDRYRGHRRRWRGLAAADQPGRAA